MTTILCVDNDPLVFRFLQAQRVERGLDGSVAGAAAAPAAIAQIAALSRTGAEVPLVIASQALIDATWLKDLYGQFPQALMVLLLESGTVGQADVEQIEAMIPQGQLYRCLSKPWHGVDLRLTVTEALRRYRHEQQLAHMQAALAAAQGQIAGLNDRTQSDRTQLEAQIRASAPQLELTLALTGIGAWSWFPTTGSYQWAGLMETLLEIPPGQGDMYQQWRDRIHPDDVESVEVGIQTALARGQSFTQEYRYQLLDGSIGWRWVKGQGCYSETGELNHVLGVVQDITAQKQTEAALKASEQHRQLTLELTNIGSWEFDMASGEVRWSDSRYRLVGLTPGPQPVTDRTWREAVHPDDVERASGAFAQALATGTPLEMEYRVVLPDGAERWMLSRGQGVYDDQGQPLKMLGVMIDISDRKTAEIALQQLNEELEQRVQQRTQESQKLATLVENSTDLIGMASLSGEAIYINQAGQQLVGLSAEEAINTPITSLHSPAAATRLIQEAVPTVLGEGHWRGESILRHQQTGADIAVEQTLFLVRDLSSHEPLYLATICRDIRDRVRLEAERKRAELALRDSEARFRQITENIQEIFYMTTADSSRVLYVSPAFESIWGFSCADLYQSIDILAATIHPDDLPQVAAAMHPDRIDNYEQVYRIRRADGEIRWIHARAFPVLDDNGQVHRIVGVANDITARKQAELALLESEERYRGTFEQSALGIVEATLDGGLAHVNQKFCQLLGYSAAELRSKTYREITHPDDMAGDDAHVERLLSGEIPSFVMEKRYLRADQTAVWVTLAVSLVRDGWGHPQYLMGVVNDISDKIQLEAERKQAEEALRQLNAELEQRVQDRTQALQQAMEIAQSASLAKSTFLANMSHELRTPLTAILGFSQLMARDPEISIDNRQSLEIINRSGEHLLTLINDILEMAKIEAGQMNLSPGCFELDRLIDTLRDMFCLRARGKGLEFMIDRHPALPRHLCSDEPKLRQVLINLVGNAIKFTDRGRVCLQVAPVTPFPNGLAAGSSLAVVFTVSDTGIGIAAENLDHLLEPFVQVSQGSGVQEGTGLGLSISRQFVQLLGGKLTVESQPGLGSTFAFTISVQVVDRVEAAEPAVRPAQVDGLAPGQPSCRILVVDNDDTHRLLLSQLLSSVGFEVCEAVDGQGAIALWESWQPQLIWLDMRMPEMSGHQVTRHIRRQEWGAGLPPTKIIALTANAFAEDHAQAIAVGCDDFVRKPFQFKEVLGKLAEHLGVEYTYGLEPRADMAEPMADAEAIAALGTLPPARFAKIYDATLKLDGAFLTQLIGQLAPEHNSLAKLLHQHLDNFAFDTIHELLQQAKDR